MKSKTQREKIKDSFKPYNFRCKVKSCQILVPWPMLFLTVAYRIRCVDQCYFLPSSVLFVTVINAISGFIKIDLTPRHWVHHEKLSTWGHIFLSINHINSSFSMHLVPINFSDLVACFYIIFYHCMFRNYSRRTFTLFWGHALHFRSKRHFSTVLQELTLAWLNRRYKVLQSPANCQILPRWYNSWISRLQLQETQSHYLYNYFPSRY